MKQPRKWIDAQGQEVPAKYVTAYDKRRDAIARRIQARFDECRAKLETCYIATMQDIGELEQLAGKDGKSIGGVKGNLQFCSFDGLIQVFRAARYEINFDERLQVARDLIYKLIDEKSQGIDDDMAALIKGIFQPNSDGMLSQSRVLGLFRYKIKASDWLRAMDLIRESIATKRGKTLFGVNVKATRESAWQPILLNIASVAIAAEGAGT